MKFGVDLSGLKPSLSVDCAVVADRLGFESVWVPEHLVLTSTMTGSPGSSESGGERRSVPPTTPVLDAFALLSHVAAKTAHVRLGTGVYNIGLRHPFVTARAVQTLDVVSAGRCELGIGAGWLEEEWVAAQLDFETRGRRVDEALDVCKRLWTQRSVCYRGEFFAFENAVLEPKCIQQPCPPILVGGESDAALRRALRLGDGWMGMRHDLESAAIVIERLQRAARRLDRDLTGFEICITTDTGTAREVERWSHLGVTRLTVDPCGSWLDPVDALRRFADAMCLEGPQVGQRSCPPEVASE